MQPSFDISMINKIKDHLTEKKETIAVAESVTAGLLQYALASAEMASGYFQGGITVYNIGQKVRHLKIDPIHAMACNCVSDVVARALALNACEMFCCDWAIGITGYASPVPESGNEVFCYYAIACKEKIVLENKLTPGLMEPADVQAWYVSEILSAYFKYLEKQ